MFESPRNTEHTVTLPNGESLTINGTRLGTIENPTIKGQDAQGRNVEIVFDTINGNLEVTAMTIDGEDQDFQETKMAA